MTQSQPQQQQQAPQATGRRLGRQLRNQQANGYYQNDGGDDGAGYVPQSLFEAALSMNPKSMLDYALAPREY